MEIIKQMEALGNPEGAVSNLAYIENCGEIAPGSVPPPEPQWCAQTSPRVMQTFGRIRDFCDVVAGVLQRVRP